jgi:acetyl esterase/lipase
MNSRVIIILFSVILFATDHNVARERSKTQVRPKLTEQKIRTEKRLYRRTPEGDLFLHFYYPADWKQQDARPAIVFFFGGGWKSGSYVQFVPQAEYFASRGLVAASADYRILNKHKTTPDQSVQDAKSALRWVRTRARELGVDANKIVASGGSAGGHLAAAAALLENFDAPDDDVAVSCKPNALVLFNPALNLSLLPGRTILDSKGSNVTEAISPTLFLRKSGPPAVIFYGTADKFLKQGEEFAAIARDLGIRADLYTAVGLSHGFFNRSPWTEVTAKKADEFLASLGYLKGTPTIKLQPDAPRLEKR